MLITNKVFQAFLNCETKAFLYLNGERGQQSEITDWHRRLEEEFSQKSRQQLLLNVGRDQWTVGTPSLARLKKGHYRAIFDYESTGESIRSRVHLVKVHALRKTRFQYSPMRFIARQKIVASDKFLVAYDALALSESWHETPSIGQILHGQGLIITRFRLLGLLRQVRRVLRSISDRSTNDIPPPILKKHCLID